MSSVDDRIVNMQFNNKQFEAGVTQSTQSLGNLEKTIANTGKSKGMQDLASNVQETTNKFGAMKIAGITAIATIASKATMAGIGLVKSLTIDPLMSGFREYQTNLNSTQTIIANTGKSVQVVGKYLGDLNHYSDQTIYNFSQMASAIGKFTAAGVKLPAATVAIKGMANAAALSGADANQLNNAMYQMSQALASGSIKLMDWNSLVNANMGGKNIQNALMATAKSMGPLGNAMDAAIKKQGTFRDSLKEGWLTSEVFTKTMKVMAGHQNELTRQTEAYTVAQLQSMGYSKKQAKELHRVSQASIDAATKIKTFPQMMDVLKESIGSGFAQIFQDIMGDFDQSVTLWTKVGNAINGVIGRIFGAIDVTLKGWRALGGYTALWNSFGNIFKAIGNLLTPVIFAFKSLLPSTGKAGEGLANATKSFEGFTEILLKFSEGATKLKVLVKVGEAVKWVTSNVAELVHFAKKLEPIFDKLGSMGSNLFDQGVSIGSNIVDGMVEGVKNSGMVTKIKTFANNIVTWIEEALGIHSPAEELKPVGFNISLGVAEGILSGIGAIGKAIGKTISKIFTWFSGLFDGFSAMDWAGLFNAIFAGSLILTLKKAVDMMMTFQQFLGSLAMSLDKIATSASGAFDQLGKNLKTMQNEVRSKILLTIAISVGILTASLIALSMVDHKKLGYGIGALASVMTLLVGSFVTLDKTTDGGQGMMAIGAGMIFMSIAIRILVKAIEQLGSMDIKTVSLGIGFLAITLGILVGVAKSMNGLKGQFIAAGAGILIISIALRVLLEVIASLGKLSLTTITQGLIALSISLNLLVSSLTVLGRVNPGSLLASAAAMLIIANAMLVLSVAILAFGKMDMKTLAKGFAAIAVGLLLMVGTLLVLAEATPAVLAAAGAMMMMSLALNILVPVILVLGATPWEVVARGIGFVAAALGVLIIAGLAAEAAAPGLMALGTAVLMLGAGMALAGLGMAAFGTGFALLAVTGTAGIAVMTAAIMAFIALLPAIASQLAISFVAFLKVLANAAGEIRKAFDKIVEAILGSIEDNIENFGDVMDRFIKRGIKSITKHTKEIIEAAWDIIDAFITSAHNHVPNIAKEGIALVSALMDAIASELPKLADSAAKLVISFINSIADAINNNISDLRKAGLNLAMAIVNGMTGGLLGEGMKLVKNAIKKLTDVIPDGVKKILDINSPSKVMEAIAIGVPEGMARGIANGTGMAVEAVTNMANQVISAGNNAILKATEDASKLQKAAYDKQAKADLAQQEALSANRYAKHHKNNKRAQKQADKLQNKADKLQTQADAAQSVADEGKDTVDQVQSFQEADLQGRGEQLNEMAVNLADQAQEMLSKANAEAAKAQEMRKNHLKGWKELLKQSQLHAKQASDLAAQADAAHNAASSSLQQSVEDRIKQIQDEAAATEQARKDQEAYDKADAQGKSDILNARADAAEANAAALKAEAARLVDEARRMATIDASKAMDLLDQAEKAAQDAQDAADKAKEDRDQAKDVLTGGSTPASPTGTTITPSRAVLDDASSTVDRYTASLAQASSLAASQEPVPQYIQNNYSPVALTASEIYRQTKNFISAANVKMGAPGT